MATNPLISVGSLNLLKASVSWSSFSFLNVTPSFLNKEGIELALEGEATQFLPAQTAMVTSPQPYVPVSLTINLLKTQSLSGLYKAQMELDSRVGNCTVRPDVSSGLPPYDLVNMALETVRPLKLNGSDAGWIVSCRGTYYVNSAIWS